MMQVSLVNDSRSRCGGWAARCSALACPRGLQKSSCRVELAVGKLGNRWGTAGTPYMGREGSDDQIIADERL